MGLTRRQSLILETLREHKKLSVGELVRQIDESEERIRQDLVTLAEVGLIHRYQDGAKVLLPSLVEDRTEHGQSEKAGIARKALECIQDGETLYLDSGTTVMFFARELRVLRNLTIITNSPPVLAYLGPQVDKSIMLVGGEYSAGENCCFGKATEMELATIYASRVIMGADSVDVDSGAVFARVRDFGYIQSIIRNAKQTILLAESCKFNHIRGLKIVDLAQISTIVTDSGLLPDLRDKVRRMGISLLIAEERAARDPLTPPARSSGRRAL
jgi:DeoR family transcriptional regulator of aga operon